MRPRAAVQAPPSGGLNQRVGGPFALIAILGTIGGAVLWSRCTNSAGTTTTTAAEKVMCDIYREEDPTSKVLVFATEADGLSFLSAARLREQAKTADEESYARDKAAGATERASVVAPHTALPIIEKSDGVFYKLMGSEGTPVYLIAKNCH